ncbi:hypothetical protein BDR07DRAFT_194644 [Suillus spraguei]|nr:hypothetical protein BDR07DRAFT_194644 [Suillus spraguei]
MLSTNCLMRFLAMPLLPSKTKARRCSANSMHFSYLVHLPPTEPCIHRLPMELLQQVLLDTRICSFGHDTIFVNVAGPPLVLTRVCNLCHLFNDTGLIVHRNLPPPIYYRSR